MPKTEPTPASTTGAGIARPQRTKPRWSKDPLKTFTFFVALPTFVVYVGVCVLVLLTLSIMTSEINRIDGDRGRNAMTAALNSFVTSLGEGVADEAAWTEAYLNTYVSFNPAWLDGTWGNTARTSDSYDTAIVTDVKGTILFGESRGGPLSGKIADHFSGTTALLETLHRTVEQSGADAKAAAYSRNAAGAVGLAAAVIHATTGRVTIPGENRRILWFARQIDRGMLQQIAYRFQLPVPRIMQDIMPMEDGFVLADAAGTAIGTVTWEPLRPGDTAFRHAASVASLVLLVIGCLVFAVLYSFRRSVERRAEADERDWINARYDEETDLINRFGLEESFRLLLPRKASQAHIAVAYVGLEAFREAVAVYGQETGTMLLDEVLEAFERVIDGQATLARIAVDEFAISRSGDEAGIVVRSIARKLIEAVSEPMAVESWRIKIGASIGFAEATVDRATTVQPVRMAEAAMRRAHETGGNHIVEHDESIEAARQQRIEQQADIRRGLEADEFDLDYQPIFDFGTQRMIGVEALLRWRRRAGGPKSPGEFIPVAESSGLIEDLGLFALRRACRDLARFPGLKLSVNVSTVQFRNPMLANQIDQVLAATDFPAERLQLEITESFLLTRPERATAALDELRARGILIALDDFGTGFSSIGYLRQFRFDRVKLDRSLVDMLDKDPVKAALVESTMVVAYAMGLSVTAEGVERREEAAALARLGCREFQGFLFSRPLPLDALTRLIGEQEQRAAG
ncbi:MAG TPA: EAL domain-containing protein [Devosia sp.]